ncbi:MAG TPA: oxygen-independent coproporphyrinogen III oxidase [Alphaproteobacteria bacterium]|nr:oxygen-independent coproporphyrinogen III oxidase [Alphaproteobacteria bacterium]
MTPELLDRYGGPVPRYTSYPTAPHFSAAVGPEIYRKWLSGAGGDEPLSLYVHVPFCRALCWFCGCHTRAVNRYSAVEAYAGALAAEVALVAKAIGHPAPVAHLHFGGGTPTILTPADFAHLVDEFRERFHILPEAEISVEIDPRGMSRPDLRGLAEAGVTRVSLGVQDLDPAVQQAVNRIQPRALTEQVIDWCRAFGIASINIDLMYGLPHQTADGVAATAQAIAEMAPDRIAVFGYAHVPWMKPNQTLIDETALGGAWARWRQAEAAAGVLAAAGYRPIGLDHFARDDDALARMEEKGRLRRNFQGYTDDQARLLIGFGASSIGDLGHGYAQNDPDVREYMKTVAAGRLATVKGVALDAEDRLRRAVIERLMCDFEVDLGGLARSYGMSPDCFAADKASLHTMVSDGLVEVAGEHVSVVEAGRPLVRVVAAAFDAYLGRAAARHSSAV